MNRSEYYKQRDAQREDAVSKSEFLATQKKEVADPTIQMLSSEIRELSEKVQYLYNIKEMRSGAGDISMHFNKKGLWLGKEKWVDIITGTPKGTGISTDGTFYGKGGRSGTINIPEGGGSFQVQNGLVI